MSPRQAKVQDLIIGSGAGGGVLAERLATAGRNVLVVEEGPAVDRNRFNQREGDMYPLLYRDAGSQLTRDGSISVLQGRCLGGSTTVNMGDCVPIPGAVLNHWRTHHGWEGWGGITNDDVEAAALVVMTEMGAGPVEADKVNRNNSILRDGAARVGATGSVLVHNRVGCVGSGYCLIGCAYDAKRGTLVVHLPKAQAAGAVVWTDARVDRLTWQGRRATGAVGTDLDVRAERVFLCAGAIHSAGILVRSSRKEPSGVGRLSLQPQVPVVGVFDHPVEAHRGVPQSWGVDGRLTATEEAGLGGFTLEGISAGPAMTAAMLPVPMAELTTLLRGYRQTATCLCLVPDAPTGTVRWDAAAARPEIRYEATGPWWSVAWEAVMMAARIYPSMGARMVRLPASRAPTVRSETDLAKLAAWRPRSSELMMISAHPQGSLPMAGAGRPRAVGLDLRLLDTDNVWVCDASLFPTSASTHTMVPTMTMAHLLAGRLLG